MKNISPNSSDRIRIALKKCLETFETLILTVNCPDTKARLQQKAELTRAKVNDVRDAA